MDETSWAALESNSLLSWSFLAVDFGEDVLLVLVLVTGGKQSQLLVRLTWTGMDLDWSLTIFYQWAPHLQRVIRRKYFLFLFRRKEEEKQAGAELCQAQVKLGVIVYIGVKFEVEIVV